MGGVNFLPADTQTRRCADTQMHRCADTQIRRRTDVHPCMPAVRRIVFGKYLNCGQTCIAPDYILCEAAVKDQLIAEMKKEILRQFGQEPLDHKDYGRIINDKHYHRLMGLINQEKVVSGGYGRVKKLQIAPTIMDQVTWEQLYAKTADALRIIYK